METVEIERRQLFERALMAEQQVSDKQRDCELSAIKIESLENIVNRRGIQEESKNVKEL